MILAKVVEDPQSGTSLNVSYADITGPVANYNPTGSPYAQNTSSAFNASTTSLNSGLSSVSQSIMLNGGLNLSLNLSAPGQNVGTITAQLLDSVKLTLRNAGYSEAQLAEILAAMAVLAKYGILAMGLGLGQHAGALPNYLGVLEQAGAGATGNSGVFGPIGQVSLGECLGTYRPRRTRYYLAHSESLPLVGATSPTPRSNLDRYDASAFDPFRHQSSAAAAPITINNNSFGLGTGQQMTVLNKSPTPAELQGKDTKNVEIAEVIVGAILGTDMSGFVRCRVGRVGCRFRGRKIDRRRFQIRTVSFEGVVRKNCSFFKMLFKINWRKLNVGSTFRFPCKFFVNNFNTIFIFLGPLF